MHIVISVYQSKQLEALLDELEAAKLPESSVVLLHMVNKDLPASWAKARLGTLDPTEGASAISPETLNRMIELSGKGKLDIIPAGYAGSVHALLSQEEIKYEAEWAISNPWKTGFRDVFGGVHSLILPFWPDPHRMSATQAALESFGRCGLGIGTDAKAREFVVVASGLESELIPCLRVLNNKDIKELKKWINKLLASFAKDQNPEFPSLMVMLDYHNFAQTDTNDAPVLLGLSEVFNKLLAEGYLFDNRPQGLACQLYPDGNAIASPAALNPFARCQTPNGAHLRQRLFACGELRSTRSSVSERIRSQLLAIRPDYLPPPSSAKSINSSFDQLRYGEFTRTTHKPVKPKNRSRNLYASMHGIATMIGNSYQVGFNGGFPCLLKTNSHEIELDTSQNGACLVKGIEYSWDTESAVSFETDHSRGISHIMNMRDNEIEEAGRLSADYFLTDRCEQLFFELHLKYPHFRHRSFVESFVPYRLRIALPLNHSPVSVRWRHLDAECETMLRPRSVQQGALFTGTKWIFAWTVPELGHQGLSLQLLVADRRQASPLTACLVSDKKKHWLEIAPQGEYHWFDSDEMRGLEQHFSFELCPLFGEDEPTTDELAEREAIPSYFVQN